MLTILGKNLATKERIAKSHDTELQAIESQVE
jgi:hypothetical protein